MRHRVQRARAQDVFADVTLIPVLPVQGGRHLFGALGPGRAMRACAARPSWSNYRLEEAASLADALDAA